MKEVINVVKVLIQNETVGNTVECENLEAVHQIIECMQKNEIEEIRVLYKNREQAGECSFSK